MRPLRTAIFLGFLLTLAACTPGSSTTSGTLSSSAESSSSSEDITRNVSYIGTIEEAGVSIYQQGTHKLTIADGSIVLLESTDANLTLDSYIGKKVEVRGSVRPTVEAGGMIMRVEEVTVLDASSSSSEMSSSESSKGKFCGGIAAFQCDPGFDCVDDPSDSCDPKSGGADCGGICVPASSSSAAMSSSKAVSSTAVASSVSSVASVSSSSAPSDTMQAQITAMSKQTYTANLWTQEYCTGHIAFCVPAHKNWYFKSFGATTSNLWHVEFGLAPIEALGDGAIVMNLMSGTSASAGGTSGQTKSVNSNVVGYLDWQGGHFEIIADSMLREPVAYMLANVRAYSQ